MGLLSSLLGGGAGSLVKGVADAADKFIQTPDERAAQELKLKAMDLQVVAKQLEVNAQEAQHRSVWVAGWRPCVGWVCAVVIAWNYVAMPFIGWIVQVWAPDAPLPPTLDLTQLWPVILGMLGLGGMRSFDKQKGTTR